MKTRFEINEEVFDEDVTLDHSYGYYEKYLKKYGFVLDKENQEVFKEFDRSIILNEGDRIEIDPIGFKIITWKCYNIDNDIMTYVLKNEYEHC
jgi:hypothetical protein